MTLPATRDFEYIDVKNDPGLHRLYAVWTDDQVASLLRERLDLMRDACELDDQTAGAVARLLGAVPQSRLAVAACDYVVER